VNGLIVVIVIVAVAVWLIRPQILKWQQRRKLREFEQEQRRKWEQHRRE
jgi:type II secretory pathway pseudopilin PulG